MAERSRRSLYTPMGVRELIRRYGSGERDFSYCDFLGKRLKGLAFPQANFAMCRFQRADLREIDLTDANLEDCDFWQADLSGAQLNGADLETAYVQEANLTGASLRLCYADDALFNEGTLLDGADLTRGWFRGSDFTDSLLDRATLTSAILRSCIFERTRLNGALLDEADLTGASLRHAALDMADIHGANLADLPLASFIKAELKSVADCVIDFRSVVRSRHASNLRGFLIRTGMPGLFADYMIDCAHSLNSLELLSLMQSVFISYGGPDSAFAGRLHECLTVDNVRTFFFPVHAKPGEKLHRVMRREIKRHDRVILVCSTASLVRPGVLNEIENVLSREADEGGREILIPITLDDFVFSGWSRDRPDLADAVRERVIADFRGLSEGEELHTTGAYERLLGILRTPKTEALVD